MDLQQLERLLLETKARTGHTDYVVAGSLSIQGILLTRAIPERMLMSRDVDCFTRADPGRIFDLQVALGEGSAFDQTHGYYLDPISPLLPTLPSGWEGRLIHLDLSEGLQVAFLEPNDAAVSKYARGDPRDREWLRAGLTAGLLSLPGIKSRFRDTMFLDDQEGERARRLLAEDEVWLGQPH